MVFGVKEVFMRVFLLIRVMVWEGDMVDVYELFLICLKGLESLFFEEV